MEILCRAVFVPLAVVLLVLAFHDGARERVLNLRGIARLERRLTLSNKGYWVAFGLLLAVGAFVRCYRFLELPMGQNQDGADGGEWRRSVWRTTERISTARAGHAF